LRKSRGKTSESRRSALEQKYFATLKNAARIAASLPDRQ